MFRAIWYPCLNKHAYARLDEEASLRFQLKYVTIAFYQVVDQTPLIFMCRAWSILRKTILAGKKLMLI